MVTLELFAQSPYRLLFTLIKNRIICAQFSLSIFFHHRLNESAFNPTDCGVRHR